MLDRFKDGVKRRASRVFRHNRSSSSTANQDLAPLNENGHPHRPAIATSPSGHNKLTKVPRGSQDGASASPSSSQRIPDNPVTHPLATELVPRSPQTEPLRPSSDSQKSPKHVSARVSSSTEGSYTTPPQTLQSVKNRPTLEKKPSIESLRNAARLSQDIPTVRVDEPQDFDDNAQQIAKSDYAPVLIEQPRESAKPRQTPVNEPAPVRIKQKHKPEDRSAKKAPQGGNAPVPAKQSEVDDRLSRPVPRAEYSPVLVQQPAKPNERVSNQAPRNENIPILVGQPRESGTVSRQTDVDRNGPIPVESPRQPAMVPRQDATDPNSHLHAEPARGSTLVSWQAVPDRNTAIQAEQPREPVTVPRQTAMDRNVPLRAHFSPELTAPSQQTESDPNSSISAELPRHPPTVSRQAALDQNPPVLIEQPRKPDGTLLQNPPLEAERPHGTDERLSWPAPKIKNAPLWVEQLRAPDDRLSQQAPNNDKAPVSSDMPLAPVEPQRPSLKATYLSSESGRPRPTSSLYSQNDDGTSAISSGAISVAEKASVGPDVEPFVKDHMHATETLSVDLHGEFERIQEHPDIYFDHHLHNESAVTHEEIKPSEHTIYEPKRTRSIHLHDHKTVIQPILDPTPRILPEQHWAQDHKTGEVFKIPDELGRRLDETYGRNDKRLVVEDDGAIVCAMGQMNIKEESKGDVV